MTNAELTIRHAQAVQPWTVLYSPEMASCVDAMPHLYASHAVLHGMKSLGKIAAVYEKIDHTGGRVLSDEQAAVVGETCADLVTIALRLANLHDFDLAAQLVERVRNKNGVNILEVG